MTSRSVRIYLMTKSIAHPISEEGSGSEGMYGGMRMKKDDNGSGK